MSDYSAAVAHAALNVWPQRRQQWLATTETYKQLLASVVEAHGLATWFPDDAVTTTCNVRLPTLQADKVISQLQVRAITARQWWNKGCHLQPAYAKYPRTALPVTERLGESVVALPFYVDISAHQLALAANTLDEVLHRLAP
ncbi:MAG: DegT/DnrJ/EryC1/StrS family aminotransferase [Rickettsiales bacterium]